MEGNQMKMREALVAILDFISELRERNPYVVPCVRDTIGMIENWADSALAAPQRNCDLYPTNEDAWRIYQLSHAERRVVPDFIEWLFAPAEERKGANDENNG